MIAIIFFLPNTSLLRIIITVTVKITSKKKSLCFSIFTIKIALCVFVPIRWLPLSWWLESQSGSSWRLNHNQGLTDAWITVRAANVNLWWLKISINAQNDATSSLWGLLHVFHMWSDGVTHRWPCRGKGWVNQWRPCATVYEKRNLLGSCSWGQLKVEAGFTWQDGVFPWRPCSVLKQKWWLGLLDGTTVMNPLGLSMTDRHTKGSICKDLSLGLMPLDASLGPPLVGEWTMK